MRTKQEIKGRICRAWRALFHGEYDFGGPEPGNVRIVLPDFEVEYFSMTQSLDKTEVELKARKMRYPITLDMAMPGGVWKHENEERD